MDTLPDDVLLSIFEFCASEEARYSGQLVWQRLVHVCRQWRSLVFGSPRSLNLQLICTSQIPVRDMLDLWPPFPLAIASFPNIGNYRIKNVDNIVAVLEHRNRVCRINISEISSLDLERVLAAMQEPFPELTSLALLPNDTMMAVLPNSFLGGSTPRLRFLTLRGISFPGLPKLLLSATHLTNLHLICVPHSGYTFHPRRWSLSFPH